MTGLGGLNPSESSLTLGLVQQQVPLIDSMADVDATVDRVCSMVRGAKSAFASIDLLVFPEYSLHGLRKAAWARDDLMCDMDGPQVKRLTEACRDADVWGCFSIMERNTAGAPFNSGIVVDNTGEIVLYVRKLHPWTPKEPWEPGDVGVPVCTGPKGSVLSLLICHDGMFPEMAREASYKGANVLLRTAGYKFPLAQSWRITNEANAFQNLAYTASVCLAGHDGNGIPSMGAAMVCDFEGTIVEQGDSTPDRVVTVSIEPSRADAARRDWGVENNIYQLGHRGFTALSGGATDCPYTFMTDMVDGNYRLPWEDDVRITDGTEEGYGPPRLPESPVDTARAELRVTKP